MVMAHEPFLLGIRGLSFEAVEKLLVDAGGEIIGRPLRFPSLTVEAPLAPAGTHLQQEQAAG